jgi:hypothetical protein
LKNALRKIIGIVLLAGILFGLFVVVTIPFEMSKKAQAEGWPSRKLVITQSYASDQRGSTGARYSKVEICGKYADTGERVCVRRVRYGGFRWGGGKAGALEAVARYPVGSEVDIYYSPDDPKETVLEARSPWTEMFVLLGLGIAFLLLPVILWVFRARIEPDRYRVGRR